MDNAVIVDNLTVNSTHAVFQNVPSNQRRIHDNTNNIKLYDDCGYTLALPQTDAVKHIEFETAGSPGGSGPPPYILPSDDENETVNETVNETINETEFNNSIPITIGFSTRLGQITGLMLEGRFSRAVLEIIESMGDYFYRFGDHHIIDTIFFRHISFVLILTFLTNWIIRHYKLLFRRHWSIKILVYFVLIPMLWIFISLFLPSV